MLAKKNRLSKKNFEDVLRKGKNFREDSLILRIKKNNSGLKRFGFIVSQKVAKKATKRNKIKRQLRELIRKKLEGIKSGFDAIVIALPGIEKKDFFEMMETLNKIFFKAKILRNEPLV